MLASATGAAWTTAKWQWLLCADVDFRAVYTPGELKGTLKNFPNTFLEATGMFVWSSHSEYAAEISSNQVITSE